MEFTLRQEPFTWNYRYTIKRGKELVYRARAVRRLLPWPRWAVVERPDGKPVLTLRQESIIRAIAESIPLLPVFCPYTLRSGEAVQGSLTQTFHLGQPSARGNWEGRELRIYGHTGDLYSLWLESSQVAEIRRAPRTVGGGDQYTLRFDGDLEPAMVAGAAVFIDLNWHTADSEFSMGVVWERTYTFDRVRPTPNWVPKEERAQRP